MSSKVIAAVGMVLTLVVGCGTVEPTATAVPPTATPVPEKAKPGPEDIKVLLLMPNHYGPNYYLNEDNFELYGWHVTRAGVQERIQPCSTARTAYGCPSIAPEVLVLDIRDVTEYDALAIMPGDQSVSNPYGDLLGSQEALDLIVSAVEEGLAVYAPCGGVRVLAAAGVLDGKAVTGSSKYLTEYEAVGATYVGDKLPPVIDGNIVTAERGLYYHVKNCEAVATVLERAQGKSAAGEEEKETLTITNSPEQDGTVWTRTFGGSSSEGGRSVSETSDGGFIIAGYTYSFGAGKADMYLIKTDAEGNEEWSKAFGGPGWEYGSSVSQTLDEGYIVTGYTSSYGTGSKDVYLIKTDAEGNEEWSKTFGGPGLDVGRSVVQTSDGDYIIAGYTESFGAGEDDVYLIKTDTEGNEVWSKTFGGPSSEMGNSVCETSDGGHIVAGATGSYGSGNQDVYLIKVDSEGNEMWSKTFGHGSDPIAYDWGNSVHETSDGGYIIIGNNNAATNPARGQLMDFYVIKTDSKGNETWTTTLGRGRFYDYGNSVCETSNGGYVVAGTTKSVKDNNDVYLAKVDSEGNVMWKEAFGDFGSEWGSSITVTKDGDYVVVGHTNSYGAGAFDVWLIKVEGTRDE